MIKNILKNKIIIIALLVLIFFGMLSNNIVVNAAGKTTIDPDGGGPKENVTYALGDEFEITFGAWSTNNNVFCVHHGQTLIRPSVGKENYKITARYEISASEIKIETYDDSKIKTITDQDTINYGQGLAYILSLDNEWGANLGESDGTNEGLAQHVLWKYIYGNEKAKDFGMVSEGKDIKLNSDETGNYEKAIEISNGTRDKEYKAVYYIFENEDADTQRLIILESTAEEEKTDDISIKIEKVDASDSDNKLAGATFDIKLKQWNFLSYKNIYETTETTKENGIIEIGPIVSSSIDTSKNLRVVIKETAAPKGYKKLKKDIEFDLKYNGTEWVLDKTIPTLDGKVTGAVNNSKISLIVTNEVMNSISLNLLKGSSIGAVTDGTTFSFDFTNVIDFRVKGKHISNEGVLFKPDDIYTVKKDEPGKWMCNEIEINALIVKDGGIYIDEINFEDSDKEIEITINELQAPADHAVINTPIEINVKLDNNLIGKDKAEITYHTDLNEEIRTIEIEKNDAGEEYQVKVDLMNFVYINITGQVWKDGQTGIKPSDPTDGKYDKDKESGLKGIKVYLGLDGKILEDVPSSVTDKDGKYEFQKVKYKPGLYVIFEYDGINYIATTKTTGETGTTSDVTEIKIKRKEFNDKFVTIKPDGAYSADNEKMTDLIYVETDTKAIVDTSGDIFKMQASTDEIGSYEPVVEFNCGLVKREFDLDLTTNLDFVEVKINGKTTDYNYSVDDNGNFEVRTGGDDAVKDNKPKYNQYIYESDYNYNIDDYFTEKNTLNEENIEDVKVMNKAEPEELAVYATYKIKLNNQTNKKAYIYDITAYIPKELNSIYDCYIEKDEGFNWYFEGVGIENPDAPYNVVKISKEDGSPITLADNTSKEIYLTFRIDKANLANVIDTELKTEITRYGSDEGFIDMNSKPGNAMNDDGTFRYEDDTDKAGKLSIIFTNKERTLSGIVWDDKDQDGVYDIEDEDTIDGVTVQLIELREVNVDGKPITLEYIWQETKTGINEVAPGNNKNLKRINMSGTEVEDIYNGGVNPGEFKFTGFIPGNYIIRYKYGLDGESYDGNAYKSTYDKTGENRYQGKSELDVTEKIRYSDAYDNEARRLGEMSIYAGKTIKNDTISQDKLKDHWMCADTNKFGVQIEDEKDDDNDDKINEDNVQEFDNNVKAAADYIYDINFIDFGLMKRPETKISLEKHITGLTIDVAGEGKILDAKFDIAKYLKDKEADPTVKVEDYISGNKDNLSQIYSTRGERGFWKLETDVNELMNGAELSAEYTYVISNDTDVKDYLSEQLVIAYENLSSGRACDFKYENEDTTTKLFPTGDEPYGSLLLDLEGRTKTNIRLAKHTNGYYLGKYYYTGDSSSSEIAPVTVRIDKIEELLNNKFNFDERINYSSYGDDENYFSASADKSGAPIEKAHDEYYEYDINGNGPHKIDLNNYKVVQSKAGKTFLKPNEKDCGRKIVLTKTLNTSNINELEFDSYNSEILAYSVASGRRSTSSTPGNLEYSYSADSKQTLEIMNNESDEFWGETIIITAPTGEDEISTTLWIILGATCALIIAGGIFGIKKFVLKH